MAIVDPGAVYKTFDTSSTAKTTTKTNELDKNAFMKMFLAQIQNQDPMNPMDATQLATQMAQFTTVEQLSNLNTTVTKLLAQQTGATNAQMINLLGREAVVR
ncbi:MAG: flagellar hook assembly protein FlgD, partial [Proteobacteria bacterium]|nr:flagellar hook assembly protein FlgD [Pseudomonadota bacterium]